MIRVSNSLDPDQDRHYVGPDLGPNCLQRLSADDKWPLARKELRVVCIWFKQHYYMDCLKCFVCIYGIDELNKNRFLH